MLLLTSTSDLIQIVTTGGTVALQVHASWMDLNGPTVTPGRLNTLPASATTTTAVASPSSGTSRNVKHLSLYNANASAAIGVTVQHTDGTNVVDLFSISLAAGYTIKWNDANGWEVFDNNGNLLQLQPAAGRFLKSTLLSSGTSFTTSTSTNSIRARMIGGGGQGGGAPATGGEHGSGGGSGSPVEWTVAVTPNTAYTYAIGAGGSTGGTGAAGQAGGSTTLTVGSTTATAPGGSGGAAGNSLAIVVVGGAGGTVGTNGTVNGGGAPGEANFCTGSAPDNRSGSGASSPYGGGGNAGAPGTGATGNAATGFGAGGGGATSSGTAKAGGAGSGGCIIIDEYS